MSEEVFAFLRAQVEIARRVYDAAKRDFWDVAQKLRNMPTLSTGELSPEGAALLQRVVACEQSAMSSYVEAMRRLNMYLTDGTIPDDLKALRASRIGLPARMAPYISVVQF
jgi:hypothetical protein